MPLRSRNAALYIRKRDALIARLGGACQVTPEELLTFGAHSQACRGALQVDHPAGITWEARKLSSHLRVKKYLAELEAGVPLRLLCTRHNRQDGWLRKGNGRYAGRR